MERWWSQAENYCSNDASSNASRKSACPLASRSIRQSPGRSKKVLRRHKHVHTRLFNHPSAPDHQTPSNHSVDQIANQSANRPIISTQPSFHLVNLSTNRPFGQSYHPINHSTYHITQSSIRPIISTNQPISQSTNHINSNKHSPKQPMKQSTNQRIDQSSTTTVRPTTSTIIYYIIATNNR